MCVKSGKGIIFFCCYDNSENPSIKSRREKEEEESSLHPRF